MSKETITPTELLDTPEWLDGIDQRKVSTISEAVDEIIWVVSAGLAMIQEKEFPIEVEGNWQPAYCAIAIKPLDTLHHRLHYTMVHIGCWMSRKNGKERYNLTPINSATVKNHLFSSDVASCQVDVGVVGQTGEMFLYSIWLRKDSNVTDITQGGGKRTEAGLIPIGLLDNVPTTFAVLSDLRHVVRDAVKRHMEAGRHLDAGVYQVRVRTHDSKELVLAYEVGSAIRRWPRKQLKDIVEYCELAKIENAITNHLQRTMELPPNQRSLLVEVSPKSIFEPTSSSPA